MTNTIQEKLEDILEELSPDTLDKLYDELHEFMCKSIIGLLQDSLAGPGISQQQIETAREFVELKPDTEAAKGVLEFLDSEEVKECFVSTKFGTLMISFKRWFAYNNAKAIEHYEKFLDLWKDADSGIAEVEDARKRLAGLKAN